MVWVIKIQSHHLPPVNSLSLILSLLTQCKFVQMFVFYGSDDVVCTFNMNNSLTQVNVI